MEISVRKRNSHGYINDVEIGTQDIHLATLSGAIPRWHSEIYLALDAGAVYGLNTEDLLGHSLIGAALGLRGEIAGCLHYDWYIGRALSYPAGMRLPRWHSGFSLELKI